MINVEKGGVDEWIVKEYDGREDGEKREEKEGKEEKRQTKKLALIVEFSKLYRGCEDDNITTKKEIRELNLRGFSLTNEFFRRLSLSKHIPFDKINSIDLRNTSLSVSPPPKKKQNREEKKNGSKMEIFDLSFLALCDEITLSSLFLPSDSLPLSPPQIQGIIRLAKNLKVISPFSPSSPSFDSFLITSFFS